MLWRLSYKRLLHHLQRRESRCLHWPSRLVRSTFIDFFKDHDHQLIRSSPVIPWNDASLAFVNAGMNQFKPVFLGQQLRPCPRATNSQKCIRVGGKHNDLEDVGRDTYHHTFFEMLGNWSFGEYFKKDACIMAWKLLTEVYKLPPERLYVTYFGGDVSLNLEADLEARDIWRSIGVPDNRILPFGLRDNFWEMGLYGPCGPCTEIHYDRLNRASAPDRVNLGVEDMIELWNLVFMQYERLKDGSLRPLSTHHVDTGMGLERLTAVLNNKTSNYDTDLFQPIFKAIEKMSGKTPYNGNFSADGQCLDTAYRILADHVRMVTVALADGLFPEDSHKLRRVMRRAIIIGKDRFGFDPKQRHLVELTNIVAESLGGAHPELWSQLERAQIILQQEEENLHETQSKISEEWESMIQLNPQLKVLADVVSIGLVSALKEIIPLIDEWHKRDSRLPDDVAVKLVDSYGLNIEVVEDLSVVYNLGMDAEGVQLELQKLKEMKKSASRGKWENKKLFSSENLLNDSIFLNLPATDDDAKYQYKNLDGKYEFRPMETEVLSVVCDGRLVDRVSGRRNVGVILNCTNFYHEAGGQEGDRGELRGEDTKIDIKYVEKLGDVIIHWGLLESGKLTRGQILSANINPEFRLGCMQHHTATHLLNSAIKAVTGVSCQRSSHISSDHLSLGVRMYQAMDHDNIEKAEKIVKSWVAARIPVHRKTLPITELLQKPGVSLLPGEVYPDNVHVISIDLSLNEAGISKGSLQSTEPCCGTHLLNIGDLGGFCITDVKAAGVGLRTIRAVGGRIALDAEAFAKSAFKELQDWEQKVECVICTGDPKRISSIARDLNVWRNGIEAKMLPYVSRSKINSSVDDLARMLRNALRGDANKQMVWEMEEVVTRQSEGPVIHLFETDFGTSKAVLSKASKIAKERPVLIMALAEGTVVCRATIPRELVSRGASATDWVECVHELLGGTAKAPRGQDPLLVCNFRGHHMQSVVKEKLEAAITRSREYIHRYL